MAVTKDQLLARLHRTRAFCLGCMAEEQEPTLKRQQRLQPAMFCAARILKCWNKGPERLWDSFLGHFQVSTGQSPEQPTLNLLNLLWAGGWSRDILVLSNQNDPMVTIQEAPLNLGAMLKSQVGVLGKDPTFLRSPQCSGNVWGPSSKRTVQPAHIGDPYPPSGMWSHTFPFSPDMSISRSKNAMNSPSQWLHF